MPNRNSISHFAVNPKVDIQRSRFPMNTNIKFTGDAANIIPFYLAEVLPGDTFDVTTSLVCRMQTLIHPIMDDMYLDTYYFFVPNRLVWDHWQQFCGEPDKAWKPSVEYTVPQLEYDFVVYGETEEEKLASIKACADTFCGSILDYLGCALNPTYLADTELTTYRYSVNALPARSYLKIYEDWFRDENLIDPLNIYTGDNATQIHIYNDGTVDGSTEYFNLRKAAKYRDYFSSSLPQPQRGDPINLFQEISGGVSGFAPVYARTDSITKSLTTDNKMKFVDASDNTRDSLTARIQGTSWPTGNNVQNIQASPNGNISGDAHPTPVNLWADLNALSGDGDTADVSLTVNDLRMAFQVQKFMERSARYGARYIELLKGMFGVTSPDARLQRSEYLGGHRVPITIHQIVNQTESVAAPLGNVGAMSLTTDSHKDFVHSFVEHGFVIGVCCIRYRHSFSQGRNRIWSRKTKFDYYWPVFANLGEMSVKVQEIYDMPDNFGGPLLPNEEANDIWGYQERWAEYRNIPDRVAGEMRPGVTKTLSSWHLGDFYTEKPTLSEEWINEDIAPIDRALAVTSSTANQFLFDILVQNKATRPMPVYSIPGLADHH